MDKDARNIYKNARQTAGLTQERWAELLGISPDSVRRYEAGAMLPSDETVLMMAETTGILVLPLWHLRAKSAIAEDMLPDVPDVPLPQAVLKLLTSVKAVSSSVDNLIQIASDGMVDNREEALFEEIAGDLDDVIEAAIAVKCSGGTRHAE